MLRTPSCHRRVVSIIPSLAVGLLIAISLSSDRTHVIADYKQRSDRDQKLIEASPTPVWMLLSYYVYVVSNCCLSIFKHCWLTTGSWKNASGLWKVLDFFVTRRVGTLYSW